MNNDDNIEFRDLTELGELCGCTEKQIRFAEGLLAGLNQTEAAHRAGYAGERGSVQLRSTASNTAQAKPVLALLALAESRGLGLPNAPGDRDELRRILWAHARSKDKTTSICATIELERIEREERDARPGGSASDALRQMLGMYPRHGVGQIACLFLEEIENSGRRINLAGLPLFKELAPTIAREYPEVWGRIRNSVEEECRADADTMAAAAGIAVDQLAIKPEPEVSDAA